MKRSVIIVVVIIVAVLGGVFAADRGVQALVERRIAGQVQAELGAPQPPSIDLGPFPFLTEIATGRISTARVEMQELVLPDTDGATATDVDATFSDITVSDRFTKVVAGRGAAVGLLSYESLSTLTGLEFGYAAPDEVTIGFTLPLGRKTFTGTATGRPVLDADAQTLTFEDAQVSVPGAEGDEAVLEAAGNLVLRSVPLGDLPYQLRITGLTVTEAGVRIAATGEDLPLSE